MLECDSLAIRKRNDDFDICNAATGVVVGTARQSVGFFNRLVWTLLFARSVPALVEVREKPDDSLLFSIVSVGFAGSRREVWDALEKMVGYFTRNSTDGGVIVYDKENRRIAESRGDVRGREFSFVSADANAELGRIVTTVPASSGCPQEFAYVYVNPELNEQPLVKMLLLGATLSLLGH